MISIITTMLAAAGGAIATNNIQTAATAIKIAQNHDKYMNDEHFEDPKEGARAYAKKLESAVRVLLEFDAQRVPTRDDLMEMKQAMIADGKPVCVVTIPSGLSCLIDCQGSLIASYSPFEEYFESAYEEIASNEK